jgi:hypothetical protein
MTTIRRQIRKYYPQRLELIHETISSLTFQRGTLPRGRALRKAWIDYAEAMIFFFLPVAAFFSPLPKLINTSGLSVTLPTSPVEHHWVSICLIIIPTVYAAVFRSCFALWTFDKATRRIERIVTNGLGLEISTYYHFQEVVDVEVSQHWAGATKEHSYCWLVLDSGYRIFLSHCKTDADRRSKNITLRHHLVLAEKVRSLMSLYTPPSQRADRIVVPAHDKAPSKRNRK